MKQTIFIALAACMTLTGCYFNRGVDETVETDRFTMRMMSWDMVEEELVSYYDENDTMVHGGTVPEIAYLLADLSDSVNSNTMYWFDKKKQGFLPGYTYLIVDRDTARPKDYTSLLHAMMKKGFLRADTTYEPMRLLEIFDRTRYEAVDSIVTMTKIDDYGDTNYCVEISTTSASYIVDQLREHYRMPVKLAPGVDPNSETGDLWIEGDRKADSVRLENKGIRIVPDPQGRKMRIIEFNRCKGKI